MNKKINKNQIPEEAIQLLPWYAIDQLTMDQQDYMEDALLKYPELQELLKLEYQMVQTLKEKEELFYLSSVNSADERLKGLLKSNQLDAVNEIKESSTSASLSVLATTRSFFSSLMTGTMTKKQYLGFAAISTLSIALLFAFISPLIDQKNTFYPAYKGSTVDKSATDSLTLLLGLNIDSNNPKLIQLLSGLNVKLSEVAGKEGMYRMTFTKKPSPVELKKIIGKLSTQKELIWFVGESY